MTSRPYLSVVAPLYRTRAGVAELVDRLLAALDAELGRGVELVLVDDACPERSHEVAFAHPAPGATVVVARHDRNAGQLAAVITGVRLARGDHVAVIDADLQDAPEDVPRLLEHLRSSADRCDVVCAGRSGRYGSRRRQLTGWAYRRTVHRLSRKRVPPDAGLFLVMTRDARDRLLALDDPAVHPVSGLARVGARIETMPVARHVRQHGASAYRAGPRLAVALRAALVLTPLYPALRRFDPQRRRAPSASTVHVRTGEPSYTIEV